MSIRPQSASSETVRRAAPRATAPAAAGSAVQARAPGHRLGALVDGNVIQRAIAPAAVAGSLDDMRVMSNLQPTDPTVDMGLTDAPANFTEPAYTVAVAPGTHNATVTRTQTAAEGDVRSLYVRAGTYATNHRWVPDSKILEQGGVPAATPGEQRTATAGQYMNMVNWDHLYIVVSDNVANLSRQAEDEHLTDIRLAYALTLAAANGALGAVIANMPIGGYTTSLAGVPYASPAAAQTDVAARITAQLPVASVTLGATSAHWRSEYQRLFAKTLTRDNNRYHTFGLDSKAFVWNGTPYKTLAQIAKFSFFTGAVATHYADVVTRPATNIGAVPSATVIMF